jgi:peptide/nickel transport system ATP-binding protein
MSDGAAATVSVRGLTVELVTDRSTVVDDVTFEISAGEIVGLVGESGSGKTTVGTALLGHCRQGARIRSGSVRVLGDDITAMKDDDLRVLRAKVVSYVPQDPATALNPALRIELQLRELLEVHEQFDGTEQRRRIHKVLADVKLPNDDSFLRRFPHQLSGGQQQRICLAMAFLLEPKVVVLDEPTTGLDVTSQAHVLTSIRDLCKARGAAALYVTHDLAVVANLADRVMVMYAGRVIEDGQLQDVMGSPAHPYTQRLLGASPDVATPRQLVAIGGHAPSPRERPSGCPFHPRCPLASERCTIDEPRLIATHADHRAACHHLAASATQQLAVTSPPPRSVTTKPIVAVTNLTVAYGDRVAVDDVTFDVLAGESLAVVGESGSGKTTLGRTIIGLKSATCGAITLDGEALAAKSRDRTNAQRTRIQFIFQNPYASLNPRRTIGDILTKPIAHFHGTRGRVAREQAADALAKVSVPTAVLDRYPRHLSGGERQRVAIARALVCDPQVLICDEVTSALDVSVQAAVVDLLGRLREEQGLSMIFVTHNLALVRTVADRVLVMKHGRIVERGQVDAVLDTPADAYTRQLLDDTPSLQRSAKHDADQDQHDQRRMIGRTR